LQLSLARHEINASACVRQRASIPRFLGQKLTVLVEARNRGYRREEVLWYFEGPRKQALDDILSKWDLWVEQAREVAHQFVLHEGSIEAIR
jgi:hypothetical protein